MEKKIRTSRSVDDYDNLPIEKQVLKRPGMWIGSVSKAPRDEWVYIDGKYQYSTIHTPQGLSRLFL